MSRDVFKKDVSIESKQHKHELEGRAAAVYPLEWPKNSQPDDYYICEEEMYELLFSSRQPKIKDFRRQCCNVMFPRMRHHLNDELHRMEIKDLANRV